MPTGFVVVPVSPVLVTWSGTGVLAPLRVSPLNDASPALAVTAVFPPRVAPEPAGVAT